MKRFLVGFLALVVCLGLAVSAQAAESDSVAVKVTILSSLSVDITETELNLGSVNVGSTTVSSTGVTVTNTGSGIAETYSLSLVNPSDWTASQTAAGVETYVLNAAFDSDGSLTWDVTNHALSTTPLACTTTQFAGDQTGVSVPYNETRTLWFQFLAPTATSVTTEQSITVTVTAQAG
jgi:hypothetical protein